MNVFNPLLSVMRWSLTVGLGEVLQHIPRSVMVAPPVELICPPQSAEYSVMSETGRVEILGISKVHGTVSKLIVVNPMFGNARI